MLTFEPRARKALAGSLTRTSNKVLGSSTSNLTNAGAAVGGYFACCTAYSGSLSNSNRFHTVRAGLNYRFGWASAPVVAKY